MVIEYSLSAYEYWAISENSGSWKVLVQNLFTSPGDVVAYV